MAIEVVPFSSSNGLEAVVNQTDQAGTITNGSFNVDLNIGSDITGGSTAAFQTDDLLLLFHTVEQTKGNLIPDEATGNTHNTANFSPSISYGFLGSFTSNGFIDLGYSHSAQGSNATRRLCVGAYALVIPSTDTLQNGTLRMTYTGLGAPAEAARTCTLKCFILRGVDVSDFASASSLGVAVARSSASTTPDNDGDMEWVSPTSGSGFTSSNYTGTITQFLHGSVRRNGAILADASGPIEVNASPEDSTNNTLPTTTVPGAWEQDTEGTVTQGGQDASSGSSSHRRVTYFNTNRTFSGLSYPYAFRMSHSDTHSDTNSGGTLSVILREASTSTPGTPASLTADYAISVTGSPSTLGSEYAVTSTGTEADLQSSYTVKLTGDPQTLSSSYAVTDPDQTSTLGSEYAVKDTSGTANLSGLYAVQSTGTPATLSSEYQVAVPDSEDLSSDYAVKVQGDAQSLTSSYAVKVQGSPPSLSSSYDIASAQPGTPATLGSEYSVKSTGNPQEVEADYSVTSTATVANLGGSYGVTSTGDPQTLSSGYAVTAPPNGVSLGAEYTVSVTGDEQEVSSAYAVTSSDEQTLTGSYVISDPDAINLSASYAVQSQGQDQDLTGTYGVTSASEDLPSLSSAYAVTSTGTAQTLDGSYLVSVAGQEADLLSDYAVTSSGTEPELTAGYAITSIVDVDNSYAIKTSDTLEVSSSYAVTISDTENLSASYALIESKTQEIQASYEITGFTASAPVTELYAEYAVINQDHLGYKAFRQLSILRQRVK